MRESRAGVFSGIFGDVGSATFRFSGIRVKAADVTAIRARGAMTHTGQEATNVAIPRPMANNASTAVPIRCGIRASIQGVLQVCEPLELACIMVPEIPYGIAARCATDRTK